MLHLKSLDRQEGEWEARAVDAVDNTGGVADPRDLGQQVLAAERK